MSPLEEGQICEEGPNNAVASHTPLVGQTDSLQSFTMQVTAGLLVCASPMTPCTLIWTMTRGSPAP